LERFDLADAREDVPAEAAIHRRIDIVEIPTQWMIVPKSIAISSDLYRSIDRLLFGFVRE
jgi:hypothetical protein